jgi:hypothetical protein
VEAELDRLSRIGFSVELPISQFQCSLRFVQKFRKRRAFALRRPRFGRRTTITEEQIEGFLATLAEVIQQTAPEQFTNIDEARWKLVAGGF